MFGQVIASIDNLSDAERQRYRVLYCGLCRRLKERHGQASRLGLTYDLTFLTALLNSLYEPFERTGSMRCAVHPKEKHPFAASVYTDYAADMTVALTYHKCLDDWNDDAKHSAKAYARLLKAPYNTVKKQWPRQCAAIEAELALIGEVERDGAAPPDAAANHFGVLLAEVFAPEEDAWSDTLHRFGAHLGRFVYFMDAALDLEDDRANGSYNPFLTLDSSPESMETLLRHSMGNAAAHFEKLPLEQDVHLLRSVVYAGVWQQFKSKYAPADPAERPAHEQPREHGQAHDNPLPTKEL